MTVEVYNQNNGIPMGSQSLTPSGGGASGGANIDDTKTSKTTTYSSDKIEDRLAQKTGAGLSLGFNATLADETLTFVTTDETPYTLQENYDYEIDLHFPAAGTLSDTIKMVVENNDDTVQFAALTHTDPSESITVGDMKQLMYYDAETGFRWLFKARYKITSTGVKVFVIYPVIAKDSTTIATTDAAGIVKPDGTTITVTEDGTISAKADIPDTLVTTDTAQTISGAKTFSGQVSLPSGSLGVGEINKKDGVVTVGVNAAGTYITIGKSNQGNGLTTSAGVSNRIFGIFTSGYTDQTFKISGHKNLNMTPNTSFSLSTSNNYCGVSADVSSSYPRLYLKGGNSGSAPQGIVKIGYEGGGTYSGLYGTFIDTDSKKGPLLGKRLWIGQTNYRASITNNIGSGVTIETDPLTAANNGVFTVGNDTVTFIGSDGVTHDLLDTGSSASAVSDNGIRGDYASTYGILDAPNGIITYTSSDDPEEPVELTLHQGLVMQCAGQEAKTIISADTTHTVESTTDFDLFYASGSFYEAAEVVFSETEPAGSDTGITAWFNPNKTANPDRKWQFKSNSNGNTWASSAATRLAHIHIDGTSITRIDYAGCRVLDNQTFVTEQKAATMSVPHRSARVAVPLTASGETVTMPATGELRVRGLNGDSVNNYITLDLCPSNSDIFSKKINRAPIVNATVSADAFVYEGQEVEIDYTATNVTAYIYLLRGDARAQGYDD